MKGKVKVKVNLKVKVKVQSSSFSDDLVPGLLMSLRTAH